jgi:hypothetical protein
MKETSPKALTAEEQDWEKKLQDLGMGAELPSEAEVADKAGVELVSVDEAGNQTEAITRKLYEEDPRNIFGGVPYNGRASHFIDKHIEIRVD